MYNSKLANVRVMIKTLSGKEAGYRTPAAGTARRTA